MKSRHGEDYIFLHRSVAEAAAISDETSLQQGWDGLLVRNVSHPTVATVSEQSTIIHS